jgi:hypothetical protein
LTAPAMILSGSISKTSAISDEMELFAGRQVGDQAG